MYSSLRWTVTFSTLAPKRPNNWEEFFQILFFLFLEIRSNFISKGLALRLQEAVAFCS